MKEPFERRILVAAVPSAQALVERYLAGCALDFVSSMEEGERRLNEQRYSEILIGHLFAESRMFEFARIVRRLQPWARVICVKGPGRPLDEQQRSAIDLSVRQLGCEGFFDLTADEVDESRPGVFGELLKACRENGQHL